MNRAQSSARSPRDRLHATAVLRACRQADRAAVWNMRSRVAMQVAGLGGGEKDSSNKKSISYCQIASYIYMKVI